MGQRQTATAGSLRDAVAEVVAGLIGWDSDDVNVMIQAKDFDDDREVELTVTFVDVEGDAPPRERAEDADEEDEDLDTVDEAELDEEAEAAADFMEGILDILHLPGDIKIRLFEDYAEVEIVDTEGGPLIGRRGSTLDAIQELLRCSMQREFERRSRVKVDVEGYRARRLEKLERKAEEAIDEALDRGRSQKLEPMDVFERKAVHNLVSEYEGVSSHSQGREPSRRVVIEPE